MFSCTPTFLYVFPNLQTSTNAAVVAALDPAVETVKMYQVRLDVTAGEVSHQPCLAEDVLMLMNALAVAKTHVE